MQKLAELRNFNEPDLKIIFSKKKNASKQKKKKKS